MTSAEYARAQDVFDQHTLKVRDGEYTLIYIRELQADQDGGQVLVVKATMTGNGLWITSFRRLSRDQAKRDREIRRLLRNGK